MGTINWVRRKVPRAQEQQRSAGSMRRIDSPRGKLFPGRALAERESESEPYRMELAQGGHGRSQPVATLGASGSGRQGELSWRRLLESEAGGISSRLCDAAGPNSVERRSRGGCHAMQETMCDRIAKLKF